MESKKDCNRKMMNHPFKSVLRWLKSTELFARPSKQIPGEWQLVEYYMEPKDELVKVSEAQLIEKNQFWKIQFLEDKKYLQQNSLTVDAIEEITNGEWETSRNFVRLYSSEKKGVLTEFQFAIEKDQLKLLKKDSLGRIEFFGFFNRLD